MVNSVSLWRRLRTNIWFVPALCGLAATLLAFGSIRLDRMVRIGPASGLWFVFEAGAEGARGVLSTIAGSIITVTGVVFSITIVVLQLASTQFTPRVLRTFTEDRSNHWVLGIFLGTFIYALLVMRSVRAGGEDYGSFVPTISVTFAVLLALVSVGFLIFFMHHVARSIRAEVILERVAREALEVVDVIFPEMVGESAEPRQEAPWQVGNAEVFTVRAWTGGYIQTLDDKNLRRAAQQAPLTVVMKHAIGDFVVEGDVLAEVWPARPDLTNEWFRDVVTIGPERTRYQDVERGIIELADIGVRSLSPSMNDPSTAIACVDRITEVMTRLGTRRFPDAARVDENGRLRIMTIPPRFDEIVRLAYRELRHHGAADPAVSLRIVKSLAAVAARVPSYRREPLLKEMKEIADAAAARLQSDYDVARVRAVAQEAAETLQTS